MRTGRESLIIIKLNEGRSRRREAGMLMWILEKKG